MSASGSGGGSGGELGERVRGGGGEVGVDCPVARKYIPPVALSQYTGVNRTYLIFFSPRSEGPGRYCNASVCLFVRHV